MKYNRDSDLSDRLAGIVLSVITTAGMFALWAGGCIWLIAKLAGV